MKDKNEKFEISNARQLYNACQKLYDNTTYFDDGTYGTDEKSMEKFRRTFEKSMLKTVKANEKRLRKAKKEIKSIEQQSNPNYSSIDYLKP